VGDGWLSVGVPVAAAGGGNVWVTEAIVGVVEGGDVRVFDPLQAVTVNTSKSMNRLM